jgi:hypothetical protein
VAGCGGPNSADGTALHMENVGGYQENVFRIVKKICPIHFFDRLKSCKKICLTKKALNLHVKNKKIAYFTYKYANAVFIQTNLIHYSLVLQPYTFRFCTRLEKDIHSCD